MLVARTQSHLIHRHTAQMSTKQKVTVLNTGARLNECVSNVFCFHVYFPPLASKLRHFRRDGEVSLFLVGRNDLLFDHGIELERRLFAVDMMAVVVVVYIHVVSLLAGHSPWLTTHYKYKLLITMYHGSVV